MGKDSEVLATEPVHHRMCEAATSFLSAAFIRVHPWSNHKIKRWERLILEPAPALA
jgi:hypothetical protein